MKNYDNEKNEKQRTGVFYLKVNKQQCIGFLFKG